MSDPTARDGGEGGELHGTVVREADVAATVREVAPALTMREAGAADATVREEAGPGSRATSGGGSSAGLVRLPEGLSSRYGIERELPTRGNEADLFVVRPLQDGDDTPVVVKLYRAGIEPKEEVLTRIAALDSQHVIRQIDHGKSEGRSYEVIEYAAEGSLADLMSETRFDEAMLKAMIREVTAGLGYLHSLDPPIVHRDVKPDNILVRGREPLDLVLTDFGLSSVLEGGSWRASTLDRTIKYAAPEASAGQVSREMDWWSLGMMVAEAASGRHPFAGVAEQTIGIHYSNRLPVPLDGIADGRVKLLCQGLLCYDRKQRWSAGRIRRWLAGDQSLRAPVEETRQVVGVPFKFAGGSYGTLPDLAAAMAANWEAAQKTVARADGLLTWLKDEAKEYEAWQWLSEITQDKAQIDAGLKVTLLLPMLDPELPVMFEGEELTPARLLKEVTAAAECNDSAQTARFTQLWEHLPALAELSPSAVWLSDIHVTVGKSRRELETLVLHLRSSTSELRAHEALLKLAATPTLSLDGPAFPERRREDRKVITPDISKLMSKLFGNTLAGMLTGGTFGIFLGLILAIFSPRKHLGDSDTIWLNTIYIFTAGGIIVVNLMEGDETWSELEKLGSLARQLSIRLFSYPAYITQIATHKIATQRWRKERLRREEFNRNIDRANKEMDRLKSISIEKNRDFERLEKIVEEAHDFSFARHIIESIINPSAFRGTIKKAEAALSRFSDGRKSWIEQCSEAERCTAAFYWMVLQLKPA